MFNYPPYIWKDIKKLAALLALGSNLFNMLLETESINPSINQSINHSINQSTNQATIQSINHSINHSIKQ